MSIEAYPSPNGVLTSLIWRKTATGGETSLSGYDNASQALSYTPGQEQVYLNGILLVRGSDYTATNGTSITGLTALAADDFVQINCYNNFSVASVPAASITGTILNSQLTSSSTSIAGIVQLTDSTSSTSTTTAATPNAVKSAYDLANGAIPKTLTTTTGDIIYASGANTPARLGIGSASQILTVSGGIPAWTTPVSGGMTLIQETVASSNASITFGSIPGTYKQLLLTFHGVYQSDNTSAFSLRFNNSSAQEYAQQSWGFNNATPTIQVGANTITSVGMPSGLFGEAVNLTARHETATGQILIDNYASTTKFKMYYGYRAYFFNAGMGEKYYHSLVGSWGNTNAITSLDVIRTQGSGTLTNLSNTSIRLYGIS